MRPRKYSKEENKIRLFNLRTLISNYEIKKGIGSVSKETGISPLRLMTIMDGVIEFDKQEEIAVKQLLEVTSLYS